jgi:hypothetical protein
MKFFLDENFPRPALVLLQAAGHQATHALNDFPSGTADETLFAHAQQQSAIFISTDKDFLPHGSARIRPSLRRDCHHSAQAKSRRSAPPINRRIELLGERDLRDTVWLVTDTRIRSRHAGA